MYYGYSLPYHLIQLAGAPPNEMMAKKMFEANQKICEGILRTHTLIKTIEKPNKVEILELLEKQNGLNITQIANHVGIAYKNTFRLVKKLASDGFIELSKNEKVRGKEVIVKLKTNPLDMNKKEYSKLFKTVKKIVRNTKV